jgi:acetyl-CoA carboxylase carboxyltransferase component
MTPLALVPRKEKPRPIERLEALRDPGSLQLVRSTMVSRRMDDTVREGDGVVGVMGRVDGHPVECDARDPSYVGCSLGDAQAGTAVRPHRWPAVEPTGATAQVADEECKVYGADLVLAWRRAQLGVMGPKQAVDLVRRRVIAAADDRAAARERYAKRHAAEHLPAASAAAEGVTVAPPATRARLTSALRTLSTPERPIRPARNIQL